MNIHTLRTFLLHCSRNYIYALLCALVVLGVNVSKQDSRHPIFDEFRYLAAAKNLEVYGVFARDYSTEKAPQASMAEAPITPYILAALFQHDDTLSTSIACLMDTRGESPPIIDQQCPKDYGVFIPFQLMILALSASLVWLIAKYCGASVPIRWLAMGLALLSEQYGYFVRFFLTEPYLLLFISVFFAGLAYVFGVPRSSKHTHLGLVIAGAGLALCALTREGYSLLGVFMPFVIFVWFWKFRQDPTLPASRLLPAGKAALVFVVSYMLVLSPWLLRNWLMFDIVAIVHGHGNHVIVERVAYNLMTWQEWFAAWIFWLPDFGDKLAPALFGADAVERLSWDNSNTFYQVGNQELQHQVDALYVAAGEQGSKLVFTIKEFILADLAKHIAVTLVLSWRGLWLGDYFGLVAQVFSIFGAASLIKRGNGGSALALLFPALFMVGLHGFVSVSLPRYNLGMLPYLSILSAIAIGTWSRAAYQRFGKN